MDGKNIIAIVVIAALGYFLYTHFMSQSAPATAAQAAGNPSWVQPNNSQSGGAGDTSQQGNIIFAGIPTTLGDYTQGPSFYMLNQPWYGASPAGGIMPMNSGSANIVGGPSAQNNAVVGLTSTWM